MRSRYPQEAPASASASCHNILRGYRVPMPPDDGKAVYGKAWNESYHGEGKEWCRTKEEAIKRAEEMRKKKICSLKKQIEKLNSLRFE